MAKIKLPENKVKDLKEVCRQFNNEPGELINVLHKAQGIFGYLPSEVQELVSKEMNVPVAKVFGVVSFYSFFTMKPKGLYPVSICLGTACYVRGAEKVLEEFKKALNIQVGETSGDGKFSLACLRCVGACGLAPVAMVGEKVFGRIAPEEVSKIIQEYE
jgi:NADH-quinone oxidoreductase subunit E/NADP-reducing hydrogenase subunit HndA